MAGTYRLWMRWAKDEANKGETESQAEEALDKNEIWAGWARVRDRSAFEDREEAKRAIMRAYRHVGKVPREVAQEAGSAMRFFGMEKGDHVVVPTSDERFAIVRVKQGEPILVGSGRSGYWTRPVRVLERDIPREEASDTLRKLMRLPHTCLDISYAAADVDRWL